MVSGSVDMVDLHFSDRLEDPKAAKPKAVALTNITVTLDQSCNYF